MAASTFSPQEIELRRKLLQDELLALQDQKLKSIGNMQVIDYHHPERSPGWPPYRHQAFPTMLYHPTKKDQHIEEVRLGIRRRNEANPNLAAMDVPSSEPLTIKVGNEEEKRLALAQGFVERAPDKQAIDANSPLDVIGRATVNPLTAAEQPHLSVETIIKLNQMPKDELVKHAREVYGVTCPEDASKVDIINAIAEGNRTLA